MNSTLNPDTTNLTEISETEYTLTEYQEHGLCCFPLLWDLKKKEPKYYPQWNDVPPKYNPEEHNSFMVILDKSRPFYCFDFDIKNTKNKEIFTQFHNMIEAERPDLLQKVFIEITRNKGYHIWFKYEPPTGGLKDKLMLAQSSTGDEVIALYTKGLIFTYPIPGYEIYSGSMADCTSITEEEFQYLCKACEIFDEYEPQYDSTKRAIEYPKEYSNLLTNFDNNLPDEAWDRVLESEDLLKVRNYRHHPNKKKFLFTPYLRKGSDSPYSAKVYFKKKSIQIFSGSFNGRGFPTFDTRHKFNNIWCLTPSLFMYYKHKRDWNHAITEIEEIAQKENIDINNKAVSSEAEEDHFSLIEAYITEQNFIKNEVTLFIEQEGKTLNESDLNSHFIGCTKRYPKKKGVTKNNWDIALNSNIVPKYNPIKNFFNENNDSVRKGYIDEMVNSLDIVPYYELEKELNCEMREIVRVLVKKWLVGCVASVYPGFYNCLMLVLIGPKGCGKTEFFRRMVPVELKDYYCESRLDEGKDSEALLCQKLIIMNDELVFVRKQDANNFRQKISAIQYTFRPPYGKQNITKERLASVGATSNDRNIVPDADNNRRIIPLEIKGVDKERYNAICKTSLFMEAFQLFQKGFDYNLTHAEVQTLEYLSGNYEAPSMEYELLQKCITPGKQGLGLEMTATEIKDLIEGNSKQKLNINNLGRALRRQGNIPRTIKVSGRTKQVYYVNALVSTLTPG